MLVSAAVEVFFGHTQLGRQLVSPAVAIGNFDGVHLGHRALIDRARARASASGGEATVLTFSPHPAVVLAPDRAPPAICGMTRKLELLAGAGVAVCVVEPFDRELSQRSPSEFVTDVLAEGLGARHVIVGYDFSFGRGRAGNADTLLELGSKVGFEVDVIEPVVVAGQAVSSSRVRQAVGAGELEQARALLGRRFDVDGPVVRGAGRGRELGVPTANIQVAGDLLPPIGIYAVWVHIEGETIARPGAASLGTNPTFGDAGHVSLEVYLLDFDQDLYDQRCRITFVAKLRGERRFADVAQLVAQMQRDIDDTRQILDHAPPD